MRPNLIHPVWVTIARLVRDELLMDTNAREPIHGPRETVDQTFRLPAQIKWQSKDSPIGKATGPRKQSSGYILVRFFDLDLYIGPGERLKRGDRITSIGHLADLDLYLGEEEPAGHYPDQDGASMVRHFFSDRHPTQQVGDL